MQTLIRRLAASFPSRLPARMAAASGLALLLTGCGHMMHERHHPPVASNSQDIMGSKGVRDFKANGALLFGPGGELQVVDAKGDPVPACVLPASPEDKRKVDANLPVCEKLKNTTVRRVDSISVLEHTGSTCVTVIIYGVPRTICY